VVYTFNGKNYFAPLHSPKEKHKKISHKALDIFKIKDGELGVVNINNMIPTPMEVLTEAIPTIKDIKYISDLPVNAPLISENIIKIKVINKPIKKPFKYPLDSFLFPILKPLSKNNNKTNI